MNKSETEGMALALEEARAAAARGEVPIGAVIMRAGKVVARAGNQTLHDHDPTAHAEMLVIRAATDGSVAVLDRGPGFTPDKLDPAARMAARGRSDRCEGLGLGLSIVERTMAAHGGSLELANLPDGGAIATMRFPAVFVPAEDAAEPGRRPQQRGVAPLEPAGSPFG